MQKRDEWTDGRMYGRRFIISRPRPSAAGRDKNPLIIMDLKFVADHLPHDPMEI